MAETLVEKATCDACGIEVRDGSAFCYNCGVSIVSEPAPPAILKPAGRPNGAEARRNSLESSFEPEPPPVAIPLGSPLARAETAPQPERKTEPKTERFPAAPARREPRARVRKMAEVEWTERSTSVGFVVAAIVLALLAGLMVMAALYLR